MKSFKLEKTSGDVKTKSLVSLLGYDPRDSTLPHRWIYVAATVACLVIALIFFLA